MFFDYPSSGSSHAAYCIVEPVSNSTSEMCAETPWTIFFDSISDGARRFLLNSSLPARVSQDDGLYIVESASLPIIAYGDTVKQASDAFEEHFGYLWDSISDQPDDTLTLDALDVKRAQRNLVSGVAAAV